MSSEKRARQRANRDLKVAAEQKRDLRKRRFSIVKRYTVYAFIFGAAIVGLKLISG